jgi:hypothetical protein
VPYADYSKYLECCHKEGNACITGTIKSSSSVPRATARRTESLSPDRQREWIKRKLEADPTIRLKIHLQSSWEKALTARRYTPRRPFSGALGVQLARLCERPLSVDENRRKNGQFSKIELKLYKTKWRLRFGPKSKQLTFADEQRCECPF